MNQTTSIFRPWETTASAPTTNKSSNVIENVDITSGKYISKVIPFPMMETEMAGTEKGSWFVTVSPPYCSPPLQHSPPSPNSTPCNQSNDSAYHSDTSTPSPCTKKVTPTKGARLFSANVIRILDHWYHQHFDHPYPTLHDVHDLAGKCSLRPDQVRKWLANKRNRSHNTLTYNGNVHPKSNKKIKQKQYRPSLIHSPYIYRPIPGMSHPWLQMTVPPPYHIAAHQNWIN